MCVCVCVVWRGGEAWRKDEQQQAKYELTWYEVNVSVPVFLKGGDGGQCDGDGCTGHRHIR